MGRITITIGGTSCNLSFNLDHIPTMPECGAREASEALDVWLMIDRCVKMRSRLLLQVLTCSIVWYIVTHHRSCWACLRTHYLNLMVSPTCTVVFYSIL